MMVLFDTLTARDGAEHQMAGLLPGKVVMSRRLAAIGLQSLALPEGELRRGYNSALGNVELEDRGFVWRSFISLSALFDRSESRLEGPAYRAYCCRCRDSRERHHPRC